MLVMDVGDEMCGDNYKILVTDMTILVINIHYLFTFASGSNIQKVSPTFLVTNITFIKS